MINRIKEGFAILMISSITSELNDKELNDKLKINSCCSCKRADLRILIIKPLKGTHFSFFFYYVILHNVLYNTVKTEL